MRQEAPEALVLALDAGTTGVRALLLDAAGGPRAEAYREVLPACPGPGLVEHDPEALYAATLDVLTTVLGAATPPHRVRGLGIAVQRGTAVVWEAPTGRAAHAALSWQDGRTAPRCAALLQEGVFVSPLAAATKIEWILDRVDPARAGVRAGRLRCGTVDAWLAWRLSAGQVSATDASNASCSGFYDLVGRGWNAAVLEALRVPETALPTIVDSIRDQLLTLPASTVVHTGHGDDTSIGAEAGDLDEQKRSVGTTATDKPSNCGALLACLRCTIAAASRAPVR